MNKFHKQKRPKKETPGPNQTTHNHAIDVMFKFVSEYAFRLKELETTIKIRVYEMLDDNMQRTGRFEFSQSHFLHTPAQVDAYITSDMTGESEQRALQKALMTFTMHYRDALAVGHAPNESWLEPNSAFK